MDGIIKDLKFIEENDNSKFRHQISLSSINLILSLIIKKKLIIKKFINKYITIIRNYASGPARQFKTADNC
jgi:hypothetical protein